MDLHLSLVGLAISTSPFLPNRDKFFQFHGRAQSGSLQHCFSNPTTSHSSQTGYPHCMLRIPSQLHSILSSQSAVSWVLVCLLGFFQVLILNSIVVEGASIAIAMTAVPATCSSSWSFFGAGANSGQPAPGARRVAVGAVGVGVAGGLGWALSTPKLAPRRKLLAEEFLSLWEGNVSRFASLSMAVPVEEVVEPTTGMTFPGALEEGRLFTGAGLRKKSIFGLKKINIYTYGVYVDPASLKSELGDEYSGVDLEELRKDEGFFNDVMEREVGLTVRLVIVYGSLKIGSVRSAFEESVGSRIKKFGGAENRELLSSFTGAFTDDIKLPKGTTIDLTRLPGNILQTKIDGTQVGSVESALLCRSLFDLYIGDDPFDKDAKKSIGLKMASLLCEQ